MSDASDAHDEQCADLKKAAAICEQRGQSLLDSLISLQAEVGALTKVVRMLKLEAECTSDAYLRGAILRQTTAALKPAEKDDG